MAQREIIEKGVTKLLITHNLRSKIDLSLRVQPKKRFAGV